jgi:hypothetical protein
MLSVVLRVATGIVSEVGIGLKVGIGSDSVIVSDPVIGANEIGLRIPTKSMGGMIKHRIAHATLTIINRFF